METVRLTAAGRNLLERLLCEGVPIIDALNKAEEASRTTITPIVDTLSSSSLSSSSKKEGGNTSTFTSTNSSSRGSRHGSAREAEAVSDVLDALAELDVNDKEGASSAEGAASALFAEDWVVDAEEVDGLGESEKEGREEVNPFLDCAASATLPAAAAVTATAGGTVAEATPVTAQAVAVSNVFAAYEKLRRRSSIAVEQVVDTISATAVVNTTDTSSSTITGSSSSSLKSSTLLASPSSLPSTDAANVASETISQNTSAESIKEVQTSASASAAAAAAAAAAKTTRAAAIQGDGTKIEAVPLKRNSEFWDSMERRSAQRERRHSRPDILAGVQETSTTSSPDVPAVAPAAGVDDVSVNAQPHHTEHRLHVARPLDVRAEVLKVSSKLSLPEAEASALMEAVESAERQKAAPGTVATATAATTTTAVRETIMKSATTGPAAVAMRSLGSVVESGKLTRSSAESAAEWLDSELRLLVKAIADLSPGTSGSPSQRPKATLRAIRTSSAHPFQSATVTGLLVVARQRGVVSFAGSRRFVESTPDTVITLLHTDIPPSSLASYTLSEFNLCTSKNSQRGVSLISTSTASDVLLTEAVAGGDLSQDSATAAVAWIDHEVQQLVNSIKNFGRRNRKSGLLEVMFGVLYEKSTQVEDINGCLLTARDQAVVTFEGSGLRPVRDDFTVIGLLVEDFQPGRFNYSFEHILRTASRKGR